MRIILKLCRRSICCFSSRENINANAHLHQTSFVLAIQLRRARVKSDRYIMRLHRKRIHNYALHTCLHMRVGNVGYMEIDTHFFGHISLGHPAIVRHPAIARPP